MIRCMQGGGARMSSSTSRRLSRLDCLHLIRRMKCPTKGHLTGGLSPPNRRQQTCSRALAIFPSLPTSARHLPLTSPLRYLHSHAAPLPQSSKVMSKVQVQGVPEEFFSPFKFNFKAISRTAMLPFAVCSAIGGTCLTVYASRCTCRA